MSHDTALPGPSISDQRLRAGSLRRLRTPLGHDGGGGDARLEQDGADRPPPEEGRKGRRQQQAKSQPTQEYAKPGCARRAADGFGQAPPPPPETDLQGDQSGEQRQEGSGVQGCQRMAGADGEERRPFQFGRRREQPES